jgi:hypothetical protein
MKRTKKLTRRERKEVEKKAREEAAQQPHKHAPVEPMFSLVGYIEKQQAKRHAKKHFRSERAAGKKEHERALVKAAKAAKAAKKAARAAKEQPNEV